MPTAALRSCIDCGGEHWPTRRGRCKRCDGYLRKYGRERPACVYSPRPFKCSHCESTEEHGGNGLCSACYQYKRNHGEQRPVDLILRQSRAESGLAQCSTCKEVKPITSSFYRSKRYGRQMDCKLCQGMARAAYADAHRPKPKDGVCFRCSRAFTLSIGRPNGKYCSRACANAGWRKANPQRARVIRERRRMRRQAAYVADVAPATIFQRDNGRCQLCGTGVDVGLCYPHPWAATMDHKIALARGGTHEPANVQLAHFRCNSSKREGRGKYASA